MTSVVFLSALVLFVFASVIAIPGGWTKVDVDSEEVKSEASFAVQTKYPGVAVEFLTIAAFKQVVAGMKYDLTVEVKDSSACSVNRFQVWDRFGAKTLAESEVLQDKCAVLK